MSISERGSLGHDVTRDRLAAFAEQFRPVFPRADQFRRFIAYLMGLIAPGERKNVESIAAHAAGLFPAGADLAQALQHFVTQSPWDGRELLAAGRKLLDGVLADPESVWVVHELAIAKRGRHSVGVQRQFARSLGGKVNCQIGVVLSQIGPRGYFPLGARLYLPAAWLRDCRDIVEKTVPKEHRQSLTKAEIAIALVEQLRAEGRRPGLWKVAADIGPSDHDLRAEFERRDLVWLDAGDTSRAVQDEFKRLTSNLGLHHFEGRTWIGWHHHISLVFTAYYLLRSQS